MFAALFLIALSFSLVVFACALQWLFFSIFLKRGELSFRIRFAAIAWGALIATLIATAVEIAVGGPAKDMIRDAKALELFEVSFFGPFAEELLKGFFPLICCLFFKVRGKRALLVLGAFSGMGFFLGEGFLALIAGMLSGDAHEWSRQLVLRVGVLGPQHACYAGLTGLGIGIAASRSNILVRIAAIPAGFSAAWFMHFWFNALATGINWGYSREGWSYTFSTMLLLVLFYIFLALLAWIRRSQLFQRPADPLETIRHRALNNS